IYTVTGSGCNETPDAVGAIDLTADVPKATSYQLKGAEASGLGAPVIGGDGTVYVSTAENLLAVNAGDLIPKGYFSQSVGPSPVVFQFKNRELIVSADKEGRLTLLDSTSFGGDHQTPLYRTPTGSPLYG